LNFKNYYGIKKKIKNKYFLEMLIEENKYVFDITEDLLKTEEIRKELSKKLNLYFEK